MKQLLLTFFFIAGVFTLNAQRTAKADLTVFPNPAIDYISVQDNHDAVGQVVIINLVGKRVKEFEYAKGDRYYVADLAKGMYLIQLIDKQKRIIVTHKIDKR